MTNEEVFQLLRTIKNIENELRGDFRGGFGQAIVPNTFPTQPTIQSNSQRKDLILFADRSNSDIVYIGFSNRVSDVQYVISLSAGNSFTIDDFRGEIWTYSPTASQKLNYGEV